MSVFSSESFIPLALTFMTLIHLEFHVWYEVGVQLHSFASGDPVIPEPFGEGIVVFPSNGLGTLVKSQLTVILFFCDAMCHAGFYFPGQGLNTCPLQ